MITLDVKRGGILEIGDGSRVGSGVHLLAQSRISIGRRVIIGEAVVICDGNDLASTAPDIIIEDDVTIGDGAVLRPGIRIGRDSVVQPGSVVMDNVLPHSLVEGVPAKVIRMIPRASRNWRM